MECSRIQERLVDYLSEDTRVTEQLCVQVHLATCYRCREAYNDTRAVLDSAKGAIRYPGPERSFESAMSDIRTQEALAKLTLSSTREEAPRWSWGMVAAAIPIVVACATPFVIAWPGSMHTSTSEDAIPALIEPLPSATTLGADGVSPTAPVDRGYVSARP